MPNTAAEGVYRPGGAGRMALVRRHRVRLCQFRGTPRALRHQSPLSAQSAISLLTVAGQRFGRAFRRAGHRLTRVARLVGCSCLRRQ